MRVFLGMYEYPTQNNITRTQGKNSVQVMITAEEKMEQGKRKLSPSWQGSSTSLPQVPFLGIKHQCQKF